MGLFDPLFIGIFAARVANCLIDLGIDVNKLDRACNQILHEIERDKRKDLSPQEAASYFLGAAFSNISPDCYLLPISPIDMTFRATVIMGVWVSKGKMRRRLAESIQKALRDQLGTDDSNRV